MVLNMGFLLLLIIIVAIIIFVLFIVFKAVAIADKRFLNRMTPEDREEYLKKEAENQRELRAKLVEIRAEQNRKMTNNPAKKLVNLFEDSANEVNRIINEKYKNQDVIILYTLRLERSYTSHPKYFEKTSSRQYLSKHDNYYVGIIDKEHFGLRMIKHFAGEGAEWTLRYAPVDIYNIKVITLENIQNTWGMDNYNQWEIAEMYEDAQTIYIMNKYGKKYVRGGHFSAVEEHAMNDSLTYHGISAWDDGGYSLRESDLWKNWMSGTQGLKNIWWTDFRLDDWEELRNRAGVSIFNNVNTLRQSMVDEAKRKEILYPGMTDEEILSAKEKAREAYVKEQQRRKNLTKKERKAEDHAQSRERIKQMAAEIKENARQNYFIEEARKQNKKNKTYLSEEEIKEAGKKLAEEFNKKYPIVKASNFV